ncbi:MAG: uracil-DNA glycosylase family protein [Nostoc sp. DcaGUA01]|nr:uracil-DNA glycosylase family protein [Nostoc sp. DcaGUA01]
MVAGNFTAFQGITIPTIPNLGISHSLAGDAAARAVPELLPQTKPLKCTASDWNQQQERLWAAIKTTAKAGRGFESLKISYEDYPDWSWSEDAINDFFSNRFGGGCKQWSINGTKTLLKNGSYSGVRFWMAVRQRAIELLERNVEPGIDYAITEIVHCKSTDEIGVTAAQKQCVQTYLREVLEIASARVVVVLGKKAKQAIKDEFSISQNGFLVESITIGDKKRLITFLPHPAAWQPSSFIKNLKTNELERLRAFLR